MNDLQTRLLQFEATPPKAAWEKITEALDIPENFSQKLYSFEEQPPLKIWKKIEATLEENSPVKVIPFTKRFRKPIRYIAAASIIAVVLITTTLMMKRTEAGAIEQGSKATVPVKETPIFQANKTPIIPPTNSAQTQSIAQEQEQKDIQTINTPKSRILSFINPINLLNAIHFGGRFIPKQAEKKELVNSSAMNNYMIYTDDDGNAMKLSKKIFSLVNCPDGDGSCKERIRQLQQKLSINAVTTDFMGILEMLRQLQ